MMNLVDMCREIAAEEQDADPHKWEWYIPPKNRPDADKPASQKLFDADTLARLRNAALKRH